MSTCFNPHPPGRVGATPSRGGWLCGSAAACFNPHPPGRVGATSVGSHIHASLSGCNVDHHRSFNPHPPGRVGATPPRPCIRSRTSSVSILTHLVGWVQHVPSGMSTRFQSITPATGWWSSFQSSPTWSGGCNRSAVEHDRVSGAGPLRVSILTHLVGWVQLTLSRGRR